MAKKAVATLRTGVGKQFTKCIKMVKSEKTGAYIFKEAIVPVDQVAEYMKSFESDALKKGGIIPPFFVVIVRLMPRFHDKILEVEKRL